MNKVADISFHPDALMVSGDLDFNNVMAVYAKALLKFADYKELVFDFASVTSCDSAGLALIIEWIKQARQQNKIISFKHLSPEILSLATASGLDRLILIQ